MTTKAELKTFFENGNVPGQEQFWAWMDSYWHKEEAIDATSTRYTNTQPTTYQVGGVPIGTSFDQMPVQEVLDFIFYGKQQRSLTITTTPPDAVVTINGVIGNTLNVYEGANVSYTVERPGYFSKTASVKVTEDMTIHVALEPDLSNTEIKFKIHTTAANQQVPIAMLRTSDTQTLAKITYGDGQSTTVSVPQYDGSQSWTDNEGNIHYIDNGNTFYHTYEVAGDYEVTINAGANVNYVRFCEGLISDPAGYMVPTINNYIQEISVFRSDSLTNLDYTFAGLSKANVGPNFKLETPQVASMNATFYGFGVGREFDSFPADMLSQISLPTALRGTFFRAGLKKILPGFLDSLTELVSVFECFKNSKLGKGYYSGVDAGQYPTMAVQGSNDFVPVSLFWKNPKLKDISHVFNYIGEGWFGNLSSGYLAYFVIRRELFWNGKTAGNLNGTIQSAFYAFGKCNRVLCEPNILKHAPNMVYLGGIFTQTNQMQHPVGWATMVPVAASETEVYRFSENNGNYTAVPVAGKGLTFDLRLMFPDISYPKVTCISGAFTVAATGSTMGFQHQIDYTTNGQVAKLDLSMSGTDFLSKFPNAKAGSMDAYAKLMLGQTGGTESDKNDGRHGVFYRLDQDSRISDKTTLPSLIFNNAIPY
ncbi:PEGA domain-containing protein [Sphingobacterium siyangense]|uniref:PEGA domain-containing protein n=1 Tax=Sphingobacterium siyangense TaxID=459529 RepID=UPI003016B3A7